MILELLPGGNFRLKHDNVPGNSAYYDGIAVWPMGSEIATAEYLGFSPYWGADTLVIRGPRGEHGEIIPHTVEDNSVG